MSFDAWMACVATIGNFRTSFAAQVNDFTFRAGSNGRRLESAFDPFLPLVRDGRLVAAPSGINDFRGARIDGRHSPVIHIEAVYRGPTERTPWNLQGHTADAAKSNDNWKAPPRS